MGRNRKRKQNFFSFLEAVPWGSKSKGITFQLSDTQENGWENIHLNRLLLKIDEIDDK